MTTTNRNTHEYLSDEMERRLVARELESGLQRGTATAALDVIIGALILLGLALLAMTIS